MRLQIEFGFGSRDIDRRKNRRRSRSAVYDMSTTLRWNEHLHTSWPHELAAAVLAGARLETLWLFLRNVCIVSISDAHGQVLPAACICDPRGALRMAGFRVAKSAVSRTTALAPMAVGVTPAN